MAEYKQSRLASLSEAILAALIAAPTALILNNILLDMWSNNLTDVNIKNTYLFISWVLFLIHSMTWKYVLRRLFTKYGFRTEPRYIFGLIKSKINHTAQPTS